MKPECIKLKELLTDKKSSEEYFPSIESICSALSVRFGYDIPPRTIKNCINYWRRKYEQLYIKMKKHGRLSGIPEDDWSIAMTSFEREYGIEPMFFQKTNGIKGITGTYINPDFKEKEDISNTNLVHKIRGVATQLKSMEVYGEKCQLTGTEPRELLRDAKKMEIKVLNGEVKEDKY